MIKLLNNYFTFDICNVIYSYINYSHDNLTKKLKTNRKNYKLILNNTDILDIITECCNNGFCGFAANFLEHDIIHTFIKQIICKYRDILEYNKTDNGTLIFALKNIAGSWIHFHYLTKFYRIEII